MAPPKASWPARVIAGDFLGLNWSKVGWMAPYNNFYPITMCAGWGGRFWSSFFQYGHFHNRCNRIVIKNCILAVPSIGLGMTLFFNADWYQLMQFFSFFSGVAMPQWAETAHAEEMVKYSWFKPGQMTKHHFAGMVSIPGSEKLIGGD